MKKYSVTPFRAGYNPVAGPSVGDDELLMEFGLLSLCGKTGYTNQEPLERAFLLVSGDVTFCWEGRRVRAARGRWKDDGPYCLHVPAGVAVRIEGHADHSELTVHQTENEKGFASCLFAPGDAQNVRRGADTLDGSTERIVRDIINQDSCPDSNLVLGEAILKPGRWGGISEPLPSAARGVFLQILSFERFRHCKCWRSGVFDRQQHGRENTGKLRSSMRLRAGLLAVQRVVHPQPAG